LSQACFLAASACAPHVSSHVELIVCFMLRHCHEPLHQQDWFDGDEKCTSTDAATTYYPLRGAMQDIESLLPEVNGKGVWEYGLTNGFAVCSKRLLREVVSASKGRGASAAGHSHASGQKPSQLPHCEARVQSIERAFAVQKGTPVVAGILEDSNRAGPMVMSLTDSLEPAARNAAHYSHQEDLLPQPTLLRLVLHTHQQRLAHWLHGVCGLPTSAEKSVLAA
jgi:hypothetical protein